MPRVRATSRVLAVLGDPVAHSASPRMHNAAIAALGLDAVYVALRATRTHLPSLLPALAHAGVGGNLTVPLKETALDLVSPTPLARAVGAVNTFWLEGDRLCGDNTDVPGLDAVLTALDAPAPWLVVGTGGSARAVAAVAMTRGVSVLVRSRETARAAAFAAWVGTLAQGLGVAPAEAAPDDGRPVGTVLNATPVGLADEAQPIPADRWRGAAAALDLVYRRGETAWVRACRAAGLRAADGRDLLVEQGALAFERFFPGTSAPREVMRAAVRGALA